MLKLRQKTSEILTFEKHSQTMYIRWLKKLVQRIVKAKFTTYFFSFSNFKILHLLIKSFVIPTPNRVFGTLKSHFLKSDLKNLKNLNYLKNLKTDQLQTNRNQWIRRKVKDTKFIILKIIITIKK